MSVLPDEIWRLILEIGTKDRGFTFKDLCCISIASRRLHKISNEDFLWSHLLSTDYSSSSSLSPSCSVPSSSKTLYKIRLERDRYRKKTAHMRAMLRKESQIAEILRKVRVIEGRLAEEAHKMRTTVSEISNLCKPEVIRGRQKQIIEQCNVSVDSRSRTLKMELNLCKRQIAIFEKALKNEKERLDLAKEELTSLMYHPLKDYKFSSDNDESRIKRRRLLGCSKYEPSRMASYCIHQNVD